MFTRHIDTLTEPVIGVIGVDPIILLLAFFKPKEPKWLTWEGGFLDWREASNLSQKE